MDLIKQYISQTISSAANNLRLGSQQIEVVALLKEHIMHSEDLKSDLAGMKKITELSKFAIRINEIYNYLTLGQVDLSKFSDKFREHSQYILRDLNSFLETTKPQMLREAFGKLKEARAKETANNATLNNGSVKVEAAKPDTEKSSRIISESEEVKQNFILEDENPTDDLSFQNFEETILKPIKPIDTLLRNIQRNQFESAELGEYASVMKINGDLAEKIGFDIIANMHRILARALLLVRGRELMPGKDVVESMRACLIVIAAVVKGKEVDINAYLNKAEDFGRKIQNIKLRDLTP